MNSMQKNIILFLLAITAVVVVLVVSTEGLKRRRSNNVTSTSTSDQITNATPTASDFSIEGLDAALEGAQDLKLDLAEPELDFDVSF